MAKVLRLIAVMSLPAQPLKLSKRVKGIVKAMTDNAALPNPPVPLAKVTDDVDALDDAEAAAQTKLPGLVAARDNAMKVVIADAHALLAYVQSVADADADNAAKVIQSASLRVRKAPARKKDAFAVKQGDASGLVLLIARAIAGRACYLWQWSTDGQTWTYLPATLAASTSAPGLTPRTTYHFRFCSVTKNGQADWSAPVSLFVL